MRVSCDLVLINYTAFLLIIINKVIDVTVHMPFTWKSIK